MTGSAPRKILRLRLVPGLLVLMLTALLCWLGTWQLQRAGEKRALLAAFEADRGVSAWPEAGDIPRRYALVWLEGEFESDRQILLDGMTHEGRAGYQVLTPFRRRDGTLVAVNRGWRPWDGPRNELPGLSAPAGPRRLEGRLSPFFQAGIRLAGGNERESPDWPRLAVYPSARELTNWLEEEVAEHMLLLAPQQEGGYVRNWRPAEAIPPSRHTGYAVQWYSLALALVVLFLIASRETRDEQGKTNES